MTASAYERPFQLDRALALLAQAPLTVIAGATDFYPARLGRPITDAILDISAIADLRAIRHEAGEHRIGANVTWSALADADLPPWFDGLRRAARQIGGRQVQNRGTVVGNVCNASPAADGVPALLALGARVRLQSAGGTRDLPLDDFILGNRRTARAPDELVTEIIVPDRSPRARATFFKLGSRTFLVISIVMVSAVIDTDDMGRITFAAVAVGACSAVACRLPGLEARLIGRQIGELADAFVPDDLKALSPIDDLRGTAKYRRDAAATLVRRALRGVADGR